MLGGQRLCEMRGPVGLELARGLEIGVGFCLYCVSLVGGNTHAHSSTYDAVLLKGSRLTVGGVGL